MFSVEIEYLIRKAQYKDQQRDVARQRLFRIAKPRRSGNTVSLRRMAGWIGTQMVKVGSKLQHHDQYQHQVLSR